MSTPPSDTDKGSGMSEGYNLKRRPQRHFLVKWIFNFFEAPTKSEGLYTAFLPVVIVFGAFIVLQTYEISLLRYRTLVLLQKDAHLYLAIQKFRGQGAYVRDLRQDLEKLSADHPDAAQILKDYFPKPPPGTEEDGKQPD